MQSTVVDAGARVMELTSAALERMSGAGIQTVALVRENDSPSSRVQQAFQSYIVTSYKVPSVSRLCSKQVALPDMECTALSLRGYKIEMLRNVLKISKEMDSSFGGTSQIVKSIRSLPDVAHRCVQKEPEISFGDVSDRTVGVALQPISFRNSGGAIQDCRISPRLPRGLTLSKAPECAIVGVPEEASARRRYVVSAINSGGRSSAAISFGVKGDASTRPPSAVKLPSARLNQQSGFYCGNIEEDSWVPGRLLPNGHFYSLQAEIKDRIFEAKRASGAKKQRIQERIALLRKLLATRTIVCDTSRGTADPAPEAATGLGWVQSSPVSATTVTATWTKSIATDVANQKIQFFGDENCSSPLGSLVDLASASTQTHTITGSDGTTYTYKITTIDGGGSSTTSACSSALSIQIQPLTISPAIAVINPNSNPLFPFMVTGGDGTKSITVTTGTGSINPATGVYSVDQNVPNGLSSIEVTDSATPPSTKTAKLYQVAARFNGPVHAIVEHNGYGYFGGAFSAYNPHVVNSLAALNPSTGDLVPGCNFAGLLDPQAYVTAIATTTTHLFVGGYFSSYAGETVQNLIKVDKQTCELDGTFPRNTGLDYVSALAISGDSLYVGGGFSWYRGVPARNLAKVDIVSGDLDTTFTKALGFDSSVDKLAVSGNSLYLGGYFSTYRGVSAEKLAKVDLITGDLDTTFTQPAGFNSGSNVSALIVSGSHLYAGGNFYTYRGASVPGLVKLDLISGDLSATFGPTNGQNNSLAVSGNSLYIGGTFETYRGSPARRLAKVDIVTGDLDTTFTQSSGFDNSVQSLLVLGNSLYVSGDASTYRGTAVPSLIKLDLASGNLDPTFSSGPGPNLSPYALLASDSVLYIGGGFQLHRGTSAQNLAKVNLATGEIDTTFTQSVGANSQVNALAVSGNSLYVGGSFSTYRDSPAQGLAKVDLSSGSLDSTFTQSTGANGQVAALAVSGSSLYLGGYFTTYRGSPAQGLAKVDLTSGAPDTTFTQGDSGGGINALAVSGGSLYVGGYLSTYRGSPAQGLAKVDLTSGVLDTTFTQSSGFSGFVQALAVAGSSLYVGGSLTSYRSTPIQHLAKLDLINGNLDTTFTQSNGTDYQVNALGVSGSSLYLGGAFSTYRGSPAQRLAKVDLASGNLDTIFTQSTGASDSVLSLAVSNGSLYVGGSLRQYRGSDLVSFAPYLLAVDLVTGDRTF